MFSEEEDARRVALMLTEAIAPHELAIFDEVWTSSIKESAAKQRAHPLGSGVGEGWAMMQLVSPYLIAVSTWLLKDIVAKAASDIVVEKIKVAVKAKLTKPSAVQQPSGADEIPTAQRQLVRKLAAESAAVAQRFGAHAEHIGEIERQLELLLTESLMAAQPESNSVKT